MRNIEQSLKRILISLLLSISSPALFAVSPQHPYSINTDDALEVVKQAYFVDHFYAFDNVLFGHKSDRDMVLLNNSGKSIKSSHSERLITHTPKKDELKTQDLVIFKSGKLRGTGILVDDYKIQKPMQIKMWLPALRKIRRFSEPDHDDIWGGTHLTYADLYLRRPEHELHEVINDAEFPECLSDAKNMSDWVSKTLKFNPQALCELNSRNLLMIKSQPVEVNPGYDYRLRVIDAETFAEYQAEYFKNGQLVKRIEKHWYASGLEDPRAQLWHFWSVVVFNESKIRGQSLGWVDKQSIKWNQKVSAREWSEQRLRKIRR